MGAYIFGIGNQAIIFSQFKVKYNQDLYQLKVVYLHQPLINLELD